MSDSGDTEAQTSSTANLAEGGDGKPGSKKKIIRLLTVMAYVSSVSGTAFMLSMYYLFLWEPKVADHHLKADPMGHQALALKGHVDHAPRTHYDGLYDGYPMSAMPGMYRPPGTADSRAIGAMYPPHVGSSPSGGYRSAAPPMGSMGPAMGPPMGTPGRPASRYDYQYQDPMWVHSAYAPQPPRPPSLSQVRDPAQSLLARMTTLARAARAQPTTPSSASLSTTTPSSEPVSTTTPTLAAAATTRARNSTAASTTTPSTDTPPSSTSVLVATPDEQSSAPPPSTTAASSMTASPSPSTAAPTAVTWPFKSRRAPPNLTAQRQPPPRAINLFPRKPVYTRKTPPLLTLGSPPEPPTTPSPSVETPQSSASPAARPVPTALLLSTTRTLEAAVRDAVADDLGV